MGGGNPLKRATKAVKVGAKDVSSEDWWDRTITAHNAAITDPKSWIKGAVNPFQPAMDVKRISSELKTEEENIVEAERSQAETTRTEAIAMKEQEKMIADKAKAAADTAKERARRLGQGRRGLLYQATGEQGVKKSTVLGG